MEFILDSQAKHAVRMDAIDKRMDGITKLLRQGMRLLVGVQEAQKRTDAKLDKLADARKRTDLGLEELAQAQKVTEKKLQRLIDIQSRRNGH